MPDHSTPHLPSGAKGRGFDQAVRTPSFILERVHQHAPIALDPFTDSSTVGHTGARVSYTWPESDGIRLPWTRPRFSAERWHVFANPPFDRLADVLAHIEAQPWIGTQSELTALLPLRSHRRYWRHTRSAAAVLELPAFPFAGHKNAFPLPCVLMYWGHRSGSWCRVMAEIGTITRTHPLIDERTSGKVATMDPTPRSARAEWLRERAREILTQAAADGWTIGDVFRIADAETQGRRTLREARNANDLHGAIAALVAEQPIAPLVDLMVGATSKPARVPDPVAIPKAKREKYRQPSRLRFEAWIESLETGGLVTVSDAAHAIVQDKRPAWASLRRWMHEAESLERIEGPRPMRFRKVAT